MRHQLAGAMILFWVGSAWAQTPAMTGFVYSKGGEIANSATSGGYEGLAGVRVVVVLDGKTGHALQTAAVMPNSSPWGVAVRP